ncbi:MAG TPA: WXG100 family type VII secretion target [Pseudonocardiaceae bacterium]|nr:WXG100 family type VII secretion target [Pseudonocardiaceae bacterium]
MSDFFPPSAAMDATASSGGPGTFLFQIVTGQPQQIAQHSTDLLSKATQFISMATQLEKASQQLSSLWSGQASHSAVQKITGSIQSFQKIIQVIQNGAKLLGVSATLVTAAQTAYKGVVGAVNPTVAGLMSNPWTYGAAVSLSTATSASLRAFITSVQGLLQTLGVARLGTEIASLVTIITEIEQLVKGTGGSTATSGSSPSNLTVGSTPIGMPVAPAQVASASGQQAIQGGITNYTPPALAGFTPAAPGTGAGAALGQLNQFGVPSASAATSPGGVGSPGGVPAGNYPGVPGGVGSPGVPAGSYPSLPNTGGVPGGANTGAPGTFPGGTPSINPSNSWIAVDPSQQAAAAGTPAAPAGGTAPSGAVPSGHDVSVTTTDHGITTTVTVPAGQAANIDLNMTVNNDHLSEHLNIGADGSVKVT